MISSISVRLENRDFEPAIIVRTHKDNPDFVEIMESIDGQAVAFPKDMIDDVLNALCIHRDNR